MSCGNKIVSSTQVVLVFESVDIMRTKSNGCHFRQDDTETFEKMHSTRDDEIPGLIRAPAVLELGDDGLCKFKANWS